MENLIISHDWLEEKTNYFASNPLFWQLNPELIGYKRKTQKAYAASILLNILVDLTYWFRDGELRIEKGFLDLYTRPYTGLELVKLLAKPGMVNIIKEDDKTVTLLLDYAKIEDALEAPGIIESMWTYRDGKNDNVNFEEEYEK